MGITWGMGSLGYGDPPGAGAKVAVSGLNGLRCSTGRLHEP